MSDDDIEVGTTGGTIRGRREDNLAVFRGVPFAQAPVGPLRFAAPQPASWDGVREAFEFGPAPPQAGPVRATGSEGDDWLTVNVWSPDAGAAGLPVLVWIYGGAYMAGSASDYDAASLARQGQVVVTFNYRIGIEGFAQLDGAPANRGLLDQLAALRWVQDNIAGFGGDPGHVTVCGQSAGAGSIATLLGMPLANGLFHQAIAQSVPALYCTPALAADVGAHLAERMGTAPTAAALAEIEPKRLADEIDALGAELPQHAARWGRLARAGIAFMPVVDGDVVPDVPWRALADGRAAGIPLVTGHTKHEYRLFLAMAGALGKITQKDATMALRDLAPAPDGERNYRLGYPDVSGETLFETVHSDATFRMPTVQLAAAHTAAGGTAHLYELRWASPAMEGTLGAAHGLDVPLLFGNFTDPFAKFLLGEDGPSAAAIAVAEEIRRSWLAFSVHGDPGWPAYDTDEHPTRLFEAKTTTAPYPEEPSRKLWEGHYPEPFDLVGG